MKELTKGFSEASTFLADLNDELFAYLLEEEGIEKTETQAIRPRENAEELPISSTQELLWLLDRLMPGSTAYNVRWPMHVTGKLNIEAIQKTLDAIVERHEVLRTTFTTVNGQPVQILAENRSVTLTVIDLSQLCDVKREAETQTLLKQAVQHPFDLSKDLLPRATLLQIAEEEYIFLLVLHHITTDGWSKGVFFRDFAAFYHAFSTGSPLLLPELLIQYADFAHWQRQWLQGEVLEKQLSYWKQQLGGSPLVLELPTDRPRPPVQSFRGARESLMLSNSLAKAIKDLSQQEGVTLFMTLLAVFKTLLYRYTGQQDMVVGSPIANRNWSELESLIGFFSNTLVLRTDLSGDPTFRELLKRVREVALAAYEHQDVPFEKLVIELQPERDLSYTPLFQVMFALQDAPMDSPDPPGLTLMPLGRGYIDGGTAKFDLNLGMRETEEGLKASIEYSTDLFDAPTIKRLLGHLQTLLAGIVANPDRCLSKLPLLTAAERHQLLVEWNDTEAIYPHQLVHQLFEVQTERTPEKVAVVLEGERLTYGELNCQANQLAHYLRSQGVGSSVFVGICIERSLKMIVAVLGTLKAGGAYVPLDPAYPQERLGFMLSDSQVPVLLTRKKLVAELPDCGAKVICLDTDWRAISQESEENPAGGATTESLAYAIYTSGSTGKPKGVAVTHGNLMNAYLAWEDAYQLRACTSHFQMASFSFDVFSGDLVRALCSGAKLVLCPQEVLLVPEKLLHLMQEEKIDFAEFVPAVIRNLHEYLENTEQDLGFMRVLVVGSDSWYVKEYGKFQRSCGPETRLINSYGVSEATIDSSYFESTEIDLSTEGLVPIGRPFANSKLYILDQQLQPVPIGIPGELYIGGAGVTRCYLNRSQLTAETFVPDPFSDRPSSRLYKTGDLARYLSDGNIDLLGRRDRQVKIRGFRIELGEIEAALNQHPSVQQTVVLAREDVPGNKRLVGYVVAKPPIETRWLLADDLRSFLKENLPNYMVPSAFVMLDALPLTPNGKVNRLMLPAPEPHVQELEGIFVPPRNELEIQLTRIWERVLRVQNIGVRDNFFELGGHSLLLVRLVNEIEKAFRKSLPLAAFFQELTTIEQLAKTLQNEEETTISTSDRQTHMIHQEESIPGATQYLPQLSTREERELRTGILHIKGRRFGQRSFLVEVQAGNPSSKRPFFYLGWGIDRHLGALGAERPVYYLPTATTVQNPATYVKNLASLYVDEIRSVQPEGPYFLGGTCFGCWIAFEIAQQFQARGQKVALLALLECKGTGSLYRRYQPMLSPWIRRWQKLRQLSTAECLRYAAKRTSKIMQLLSAKNISNSPGENNSSRSSNEYRRQVFKTLRLARTSYVPQFYSGPVALFFAREGTGRSFFFPKGGWGEIITGALEVHVVPGDHESLFAEPNVQVLIEILKTSLDKAQATN